MNDTIKIKLSLLPDKPGCYLMKDSKGHIIYVGKAKNLKNRVKSYFTGSHNLKTTKLVSEIEDFDYIITSSNKEAFVLEINLIKQHDPKYNILLKDDKTYPYIALTKEKNPRLIVTRIPRKKQNAKYFGPYPNVKAAKDTCVLLNRIYPLRKCQNLGNKVCLYYHLNQCLGPCINKNINYDGYLRDITNFLNGDTSSLIKELNEQMLFESNNLNFEKALEYRDLINSIESTTSKQKIDLNSDTNADYVGLYSDEDNLSIHILMMRNGVIVLNDSKIIPLYNNYLESVETFLTQYYNPSLVPNTIYVDNLDNYEELSQILETEVTFPQKGKKREVLDLANLNAKKDLETKANLIMTKALKNSETINKLGELLHIDPPNYIESFDNSNLFGEYPISAMVVYINGKPEPSMFRKYHVKTVVGANDYETMKEVIYRRYLRLSLENKPLPDLILMDGGKIQVNACLDVLKSLNLNINVAGIQKDNHHKATILYYNEDYIKLDKNSDVYLLLANISQRVHDFAISFFRSNKVKGMFASKLDNIKGLGPKRKELLLKEYITIDNIKKQTPKELQKLGIPLDVCQNIIDELNRGEDVENDN